MTTNPTAWVVAGTVLLYVLFYGADRIRFVLRAPAQRWRVAAFDVIQLSIPPLIGRSLSVGSNAEMFFFGCAIEGVIIAIVGGIELRALRRFDPSGREQDGSQERKPE